MKDLIKYVVVAVVASLICVCVCCFGCKKGKSVAVVDVQKVVSQSRPVAELRNELQTQMNELQAWINKSNEEVEKLAGEEKEQLTKKYQEELIQRQQEIQKAQAEKLQQLDADLTKLIEKVAKEEGFNVTFVKTSIAAGGTDITDKVIEKLSK